MNQLIILKCDDPKKWYADKVGYVFPVIAVEDEYKTRQPEGYINFISIEDAEVIT